MKEAITPMSTSIKLTLNDGTAATKVTQYRSLIRGMQYLALTYPDIACTINKLAQYMHAPVETHWIAAKDYFNISNTIYFGLNLHRAQPMHLTA